MSSFLNLGCGSRYIDGWTNIDFISNAPSVKAYNLAKGKGEFFVSECYRVLKKNGVIRIVVPDLEQIVRSYLSCLENVKYENTSLNKANHEWSIIELIDQMVRNQSGGAMLEYWSKAEILNDQFVTSRLGFEFTDFRKRLNVTQDRNSQIESRGVSKFKHYLRLSTYRKLLLKWLSKEDDLFELLDLAHFRADGEVHQWMYDSYSLGELLRKFGFIDIKVVDAFSSSIPNWYKYNWLDAENGVTRKPDSLFMEARK
jgi:hypothetical protein